ncbi:9387_t:CDS:1, partial [Cetraspora pellucida]
PFLSLLDDMMVPEFSRLVAALISVFCDLTMQIISNFFADITALPYQ